MTPDDFFAGQEKSKLLFDAVHQMVNAVGSSEVRVSRSQIAFRRRKAYAWVWMPGKYLYGKVAPLVLTIALHRRDGSPRWKEIVEPYPGRFTHHLELNSIGDIDDEVSNWLSEAWSEAA
ncbi:MAG: DUF5655 domain-containing protein [Omnitrophica WOR_2 bacterium]